MSRANTIDLQKLLTFGVSSRTMSLANMIDRI